MQMPCPYRAWQPKWSKQICNMKKECAGFAC
jgi:hypothetical protein